ncbi:MurR/RpiR family transcriptional regulator [Kushneria aurantia]|uniref:MurR/RpiR family transcriptional regulator n=1 Tax=Kushneria aurantia TaxID=504092 RepID=A0ABV6G493_9GAMM|nr:MurR/RpiR family transcriptional regulator [Kushneria aurantia]
MSATPESPASQHIGQLIRQRFETLTPHERRVATFILDHFDDFAVYNAAELARLSGVSKATVTRLFKRLGFESFRDVREHARTLRNHGVPLVTDAAAMGQGLERFTRHFERERHNLHRCLEALGARTFDALVDALDRARRVVVIGYRNAYPVALHLRQQLIQAREGVALAPQPGQSLGEEIAALDERDLVIVMGFRRRPRHFAALIEMLAAGSAASLLIADPGAGRYREQVRWFIECPLESVSAFDSYASAMSLVNLIANALLHQRLAEGRARIQQLNELYGALDEIEPGAIMPTTTITDHKPGESS